MLFPPRANYLVACARRLPVDCTRYLTYTSDGSRRNIGQLPKAAKVSAGPAPDPLPPSPVAHPDSFDEGNSLTAALSHYSSLPPLPPLDRWISHFPYGAPVVRDRISIRSPASAIRVAQSFINSKKTTTGNPKVVIEAFPGELRLGTLIVLLSSPV
jgi:transcription factor 1